MTPEQLMSAPLPAPKVLPRAFRDQIATYAAEMDLLHPRWRSKVRDERDFSGDEFNDTRARIKWLLKRISLLSQMRDWPVVIAWKGRTPYAHPVEPQNGVAGETPPVGIEPPPVSPFDGRDIEEQRDRNRAEGVTP